MGLSILEVDRLYMRFGFARGLLLGCVLQVVSVSWICWRYVGAWNNKTCRFRGIFWLFRLVGLSVLWHRRNRSSMFGHWIFLLSEDARFGPDVVLSLGIEVD